MGRICIGRKMMERTFQVEGMAGAAASKNHKDLIAKFKEASKNKQTDPQTLSLKISIQ